MALDRHWFSLQLTRPKRLKKIGRESQFYPTTERKYARSTSSAMNMNESSDAARVLLKLRLWNSSACTCTPRGSEPAAQGCSRFRIPPRICQIECDVIMDAALAVLPARPRWELQGKTRRWKSLAATFARAATRFPSQGTRVVCTSLDKHDVESFGIFFHSAIAIG